MNVIQINVSKQKLITKADFALVSGTKGKYGVQVKYDSEWDELPYKLLMIKGSKTIKVRDTGEIINIPYECIEEPCYLQFGLIGLDGNGEIRITTYSETKENTFYVHSSDWNGESKEDIVEPPTPTIWESLVTDIDKLRVDISLCKQEIIENKQQISALFDIIENFPSGGTGGNIVVDSELSMESKNPVQNKVVAENFSKLSQEIDDLKILSFNTVEDMKSCEILTEGVVCKTLGYRTIGDGGDAIYNIVSTTDSTTHQETLVKGLYASLKHNGVINVKQLGAYGDGVNGDGSYIQKAINLASKSVIIPEGKYMLWGKISVKNKQYFSIHAENAMILNDSNDYAFQISGVNACNFYFDRILGRGTLSGGLEFYSKDNSTYVQYVNVYFKQFICVSNCVYAHADGGWVTELRFFEGRVEAFNGVETAIGFKFDNSNNKAVMDHFTFDKIGIEGIKTGFHFIGKTEFDDDNETGLITGSIFCINVTRCRSCENFTTLVKTEGIIKFFNFESSCLTYLRQFDFSEKTFDSCLNSPLCDEGGMLISWYTYVDKGKFITKETTQTLHSNTEEIDLTQNYARGIPIYNCIYIDSLVNTVKLSNQYGGMLGQNEVLLYVLSKSIEGFTVYDYENNVICDSANINNGDLIRLKWYDLLGWIAEKLNTIALATS